jgi:predicted phosphoribosyltransferase/dienelactone hydrolase
VPPPAPIPSEVFIPTGAGDLPGLLTLPPKPGAIVLFAHGSDSSRLSPRNRLVADALHRAGLATLLFDLLTEREAADRTNVFDIQLLARRLALAAHWVRQHPETVRLPIGYFGASTGAAAALVAAADDPAIFAIVSRGGRPDLASACLPRVAAPTLLIVGGDDTPVIQMNREALALLRCPRELAIVPGATHLFEEHGALEQVAALAQRWFSSHLPGARPEPTADEAPPAPAPSPASTREATPALPPADEAPATAREAPPDESPLPRHPRFLRHGFALFESRDEAGRQLAAALRELTLKDPLVLAIPRGGLEVGAAIARELRADLDVVLSRKIRCPIQPELALGAVSEDGSVYLDPDWERRIFTDEDLAQEREHQLEEIRRRAALFRAVRPPAPIAGRSVIVTDDGLATGSTMIAALQTLRQKNPHELIVAVPVAPPDRLDAVRPLCDRVVCLHAPDFFISIGQFYRRFDQLSDHRALAILRELAPPARAGSPSEAE